MRYVYWKWKSHFVWMKISDRKKQKVATESESKQISNIFVMFCVYPIMMWVDWWWSILIDVDLAVYSFLLLLIS